VSTPTYTYFNLLTLGVYLVEGVPCPLYLNNWKRIVIWLGVQKRNTRGVLFVRRGFSFEEQRRQMEIIFQLE